MRSGRNWPGLLIAIALAAANCSRRSAEPVKPFTIEEALTRLERCEPQSVVAGNITLAIQSVTHEAQATKITIAAAAAAAAAAEPADFDLPVYRLSRGRWVINAAGRAYLLDEECREYKLKDRKSLPGFEIPLDGRIRLKPGRKFEAVLVFPRFSERSRAGLLIYGERKLPFVTGIESR